MKVKVEIESEVDIQSAMLNFKYVKGKAEPQVVIADTDSKPSGEGLLKKASKVKANLKPIPNEFKDISV